MTNNEGIYDFIAVGVGPFNLGLAALTSTLSDVNGLFLEQQGEFNWHPGLMIEGVHLQTPFLSDLVTLADPTHPLSFLNYIKKQGRIYSFYIREDFFLLREEYNRYCQWAAKQIPSILWNHRVDTIKYQSTRECYEVFITDTHKNTRISYLTKKLVLGTGPQPNYPSCCKQVIAKADQAFHATDYLPNKADLKKMDSITIVGSGQSAAEIFYDLLQDVDKEPYTLNWSTSSPRFYPLEYSKLTLEMTSPEYVDYFHALPEHKRLTLIHQQKNLYKGIDSTLINAIYDLLYAKRLIMDTSNEQLKVNIFSNCRLENVLPERQRLTLDFYHAEKNESFTIRTQGLIMSTGFQYREPSFLRPIRKRIRYTKSKQFDVQRNYSIDNFNNEIFVQNAELNSHGFVTPDLGMACYRNSNIIKEITGVEHYPIEERIAFQDFGIPQLAQTLETNSEHQLRTPLRTPLGTQRHLA
ncbi:MAG: SidA/IucD/PvdA family monooxygenase [Gammaproteobacteria bacterium]|nr:SidA/IucD/PvdA family monooxygenase [Gammaproteobacteria bacterium]